MELQLLISQAEPLSCEPSRGSLPTESPEQNKASSSDAAGMRFCATTSQLVLSLNAIEVSAALAVFAGISTSLRRGWLTPLEPRVAPPSGDSIPSKVILWSYHEGPHIVGWIYDCLIFQGSGLDPSSPSPFFVEIVGNG